MKKALFFMLSLILVSVILVSCADTPKTPSGDDDTSSTPETTSSPEETGVSKKPEDWPDENDFTFFEVFPAPESTDYREVVMNHMLDMAKYKWTPAESFTVTWKEQGDFSVNLSYEKGKTYYGIPYGRTNASFGLFKLYLDENDVFSSPSYYYEEIVGNHCSSSMVMSFQQVIPYPMGVSLKPYNKNEGMLSFPTDLKAPSEDGRWISKDLFDLNGMDAIFEAYAKLDKGDILYKSIDGSGHTRLVSRVELVKSTTGAVNPTRSKVYCVEQTNAWFNNDKNTTWWIDKAYTFKDLYSTFFMPVTLDIYHDENAVSYDAYIAFDGKNTYKTLSANISGTITSNFPLNYVKMEIEDENGNIVREVLKQSLAGTFKYNLRNSTYDLNAQTLEKGNYKFTLKTGIARGDCIVEQIEFTVE